MQRTFFAILSPLLAATTVCAGDTNQVPLQDGAPGATPAVNAFNTPTKASDQVLVATTPTPSFYYGFTQCNCDGDIYSRGNLNFVIMNRAMATPIPTLYTNDPNGLAPRTPHLFRDAENQFEGQWKNVACTRAGAGGKTNLIEYAINNTPGTNGYKFDRVVYMTWNVGKDQPMCVLFYFFEGLYR
ncbi:hypothetical protein IW261DRAFT_1529885 [Armillaria novae-zelandiae]|uniref:Uncharacterized protein n=1 Tax=Armillaria novae-zelandiae TaxID=153914 RepID=A0AA39N9J1_9AGAR|nr:hypothetical protein IW261DRAFT_1529885 [Armillaria novae-zelandiae]